MEWAVEDHRGFTITHPTKKIFTTMPVQVTVRGVGENARSALRKKSGDIIEGSSVEEAVENAKAYINDICDRALSN